MQKVITVSLNGNAYQFDEHGYDVLRAYLTHAELQLGSDADAREIVRDLEQSIGDKCSRFLRPGKNVVSSWEVEQIIREIGPVENGGIHGDAASDPSALPPRPARLHQLREGAMLSGVCNGVAAYFNVDPTIVRVAFVIGVGVETAVTNDPPWMSVMFYALLVFLVPYAETPEQLRAAHGASDRIPFRVHGLVKRVKARFRQPAQSPVASRPSSVD